MRALPTFLPILISALLLPLATLATAPTLFAQDVVITIDHKEKVPPENKKQPFTGTRPAVDMAVLLDTSNSMDGLISQAKSQLWTIVQQFSKAKKSGKTPTLRVAVFEYGNTNLPASEHYIRQVVGLTDDLDKVSEALFSLTTKGGDEYCGKVIDEALTRLDWSDQDNAYKTIFIAGNERFTQGPMNYKKSCKRAIEAGVVVNTIHCGDYSAGVSGKWEHGAQLAEGEFMNIDQDRKVVAIETPQDRILIELNTRLNKTYLWYGAEGKRKRYQSNQIEQDENSFKAQGISGLSGRAGVKGGGMGGVYSNVDRDLIDSYNADKSSLSKIADEELPDAIANLPSSSQRAAAVKEMAAERAEVQKLIAEANRKRSEFIEAKKRTLTGTGAALTLGDAIQTTVAGQLQASGFEIEK